MNEKISIIIPAYNIEKYIKLSLDSVLSQSHKNIEVIVVNDGSTDKTGEIIDSYAEKDSRVKAIHKENGGVSSARIAGINASSGQWIGFVDGDDFVEQEMFEHLLKNAVENNADISHCGYQMVFPDGHIDMYYNTSRKETMNKDHGVEELIRGTYVEPGIWNKLFKRDIVIGFEKSHLWDSSIRINEDLLMNYILFSKAESSVYEDKPFYHYVLRKGSAATTKKPGLFKIQNPVKVMELILEDAKKNDDIYTVAAERYLRVLIGTAQQTDYKEEAKTAKKKIKNRLKEFIRVKGISKKVLLMALMVAYAQPIYKLVRRIYEMKTGIDKKYDLE